MSRERRKSQHIKKLKRFLHRMNASLEDISEKLFGDGKLSCVSKSVMGRKMSQIVCSLAKQFLHK